jgi:hypothetical protein
MTLLTINIVSETVSPVITLVVANALSANTVRYFDLLPTRLSA